MKRSFAFYACAIILSFLASPLYAAPRVAELTDERDEEIKQELVKPPQDWITSILERKEDFKNKYGTTIAVLFNYQQQLIVGGQKRGRGKPPWYYNIEIVQNLWKGAWVTVDLEGGAGRGVDQLIPTVSGFDSNSGEYSKLYVPYFMLGQNFFNDRLYFAGGKIDLSDWFDANTIANSADVQFTSPALINNNTIPFPQKGLGFVAGAWILDDLLYAQAGISNPDSKSTAIKSNNLIKAFVMAEVGITPQIKGLKGNYRFMFRMNRQRLEELYDPSGLETKYGDMGEAISFDQQVTKRITVFLRYGHADKKVRPIADSWSTGFQLDDPLPGRKFDYCAFGVAQSLFGSDYRNSVEPKLTRSEMMFETYYCIAINQVFSFTPDVQVVVNPGGNKDSPTAVVLNGRFLVLF